MLAFVEHRYPALWPWIQLMRLDRPIGSMLLMWPTLWALWIAGGGTPSLKHIVIFVLGVFVMRAAGCVINDFADRDFDGHVTRPAISRPPIADLAHGTSEIAPADIFYV